VVDADVLLARIPLFTGIGTERLARLAACSAVRKVGAGEVIALRGEPCTHLIVVETGALTAVYDTVEGRRMRLGEYPAPCAVDKAAVLDAGGHTATWVAARPSRLRLVPSTEVHAVLDDVPAARAHVLAHLAGQLRHWQAETVRASLADAVTRTAAWLVHAAGDGVTRIELPAGQQGLAESIGMTRVSVNRALAMLAREGLVRTEPGAVVIRAPELLTLRATRTA
jgi:CRP/FNR family transcriptional regulator, cyclic AMP receptor protein